MYNRMIIRICNTVLCTIVMCGISFSQEETNINEIFLDYTTIRTGKNSRTSTRESTIKWGMQVLADLKINSYARVDEKAEIIQNYIHENFGFSSDYYYKLADFIDAETGNCNSHSRMGIFLLRLAGIPAKFAWESHLITSSDYNAKKAEKSKRWIVGYYTSGHVWILFFDGKDWIPFDSAYGYTGMDHFVKYRWYGLNYETSKPPFVIWEDTGFGFEDMNNITESVWKGKALNKQNELYQSEWYQFIELFYDKDVASTFHPLPNYIAKEIENTAKKYYEYKKISKKEMSASLRKFIDSQKSLTRDKEYIYITKDEMRFLGFELIEKKKFKESIELFEMDLRFYPNSSSLYKNLGDAYFHNDNIELAILSYKKAVELNPENNYYKIKLVELEMSVK